MTDYILTCVQRQWADMLAGLVSISEAQMYLRGLAVGLTAMRKSMAAHDVYFLLAVIQAMEARPSC